MIEASSDLRRDSGRFCDRSMFAATASASNGVPSWNVTPSRSCIVSEVLSSDHSQPVASCGISSRSGVMSTSLSQSAV